MILKFTLHGHPFAADMSKVQAMSWHPDELCTMVYLEGACDCPVPLPFDEVFKVWLWRHEWNWFFSYIDLDTGRMKLAGGSVETERDRMEVTRLQEIYRAHAAKIAEAPPQPEEVPLQ